MISGRRPDALGMNLCEFLWAGTSRVYGSKERNYAGLRKDTGKPSVHKLSLLVGYAMLALALAF